MSLNSDMDAAIIALAKATEEHTAARMRAEEARRDETATLNKLNDAQKRLDQLVAGLKKGAPWGSDWHRSQVERVPV